MTANPAVGDLLYSEVEEDLRASVRSLLDKRAAADDVLARTESAEPVDTGLWHALAELGCAGLAVPESTGGSGASWREAAVVAEELGRAVAPVPFLGCAGLATAMLLTAGDTELLPGVASGERIAALAVPFGTAPSTVHESTVEFRDGGLYGTVRAVGDARAADVLLVPAGDTVYAVAAADARMEPAGSLDMTRPLVDVTVDGATGREVGAAAFVDDALRVGAALLAAEQVGLAERCLDATVEYVRMRRQFGRIIGSYQALKHRLADVWVLITQARAAARYAADCVATGTEDSAVAVALAQAHCSTVVQQAAEECLQMHGGIGFTWEHPAHLYLKRAKSSALALGGADRHRQVLARLQDIPG